MQKTLWVCPFCFAASAMPQATDSPWPSDPVVASSELAGIHFTGSTPVFQGMWRSIGGHIDRYKTYPRIVGETGGKDFIFAHPSADVAQLVANAVRGAFEFQGQKCSAASRMYVPKSLWGEFRDRLLAEVAEIAMGDIQDFSNFCGAVIDEGVDLVDAAEGVADYTGLSTKSSAFFVGASIAAYCPRHLDLLDA